MVNLKDLTLDELILVAEKYNEPKYKAKSIFSWLYKNVKDIDEMTDLSKSFREKLKESYFISSLSIEECYISKRDETRKYLFKLSDGSFIESVLMKYNHGWTICVSSQVGCRMGCKFCASTLNGKFRDLTPGEIIDQILTASSDAGVKISNIVMMGIGEPLDNYDNLTVFLKNISNEAGLNIGMRHITVSTCGIVDKIYDLADLKLQITLSISLHASSNETRSKIMPINNAFPIEKLLKACDYYIEKTNRRITFEYTLINGVNDNLIEAESLYKLLKNRLCHVNLIPVNPVTETGFKRPDRKNAIEFCEYLTKKGISATIRREMGTDINAACGQLRNKKEVVR